MGEEVRLEVGIEPGGQIGQVGRSEPGGQTSLLASGALWQKDEGQVGGGGDGLMVEGQDRSGLESYLTWASPSWQAQSGN